MACGENPRPGGQFKTRHKCVVKDFREFRANQGSTEHSPSVFEVEAALWSIAAKKAGKWYRGILEAAKRFMVKWHEDEAQLSRQRRASAVGGAEGNEGRSGHSRSGRKPDQGNGSMGGNWRSIRETAVDGSRKETADGVARHQAD